MNSRIIIVILTLSALFLFSCAFGINDPTPAAGENRLQITAEGFGNDSSRGLGPTLTSVTVELTSASFTTQPDLMTLESIDGRRWTGSIDLSAYGVTGASVPVLFKARGYTADGAEVIYGEASQTVNNSGGISIPVDLRHTDWTWRNVNGPHDWLSIAGSSDGQRLAAVERNGYLFLSSDYGASWTRRPVGDNGWYSVSCSDDGSVLAVCSQWACIFTSGDYGTTWTLCENSDAFAWRKVILSANGQYFAAVPYETSVLCKGRYESGTWTLSSTISDERIFESAFISDDGQKIVATAWDDSVYVSGDGGWNWTQSLPGVSGNWRGLAGSPDGTYLAVTEQWEGEGGGVWTSADGGENWIKRSAAILYGMYITVSDDGGRLVVVENNQETGGSIHASSDSGENWTELSSAGTGYWRAVTASDTGTYIAAVEDDSGTGGSIRTSENGGASWTESAVSGTENWDAIACSGDGMKLAVLSRNGEGYITMSDDGGVSWGANTASGNRLWQDIAISLDGDVLAAVPSSGFISTSANGGGSWNEYAGTGTLSWASVAVSPDGTVITAGTAGGSLWISENGGAFTEHAVPGITSVALSGDGGTIAVTDNRYPGGYIYISMDGGNTWNVQIDPSIQGWTSVAVSGDGTKIAAAATGLDWVGGHPWYGEWNGSGWDWTERTSAENRTWYKTVMSSDGTKLFVSGYTMGSGWFATSTDSGLHWTTRTVPGADEWFSVACSSDGSKVAAVPYEGGIWTSGY